MTKDPRRLAELLDEGRLAALRNEARRRREATVDISSLLAPDEAAHVIHASRRADGGLVLIVDSPAWAARLRYRAAETGFATIEVKVQPR